MFALTDYHGVQEDEDAIRSTEKTVESSVIIVGISVCVFFIFIGVILGISRRKYQQR